MSPAEQQQANEEPTDQPKVPSALVISRVVPVLIVVAATVVAGVWRTPQVRLWAIEHLGPRNMIDLEAAMSDPDDEIATRACEQILLIDKPWTYSVSYDTLQERPSVALACLERVGEKREDEPENESDDITRRVKLSPVSRAQLIASRLARRWLTELSEGRADSCMAAHSAARALEFAEFDKTYPLMRCAVTAKSAEIGECCVNQLGGEEKFAELLENPAAASLPQVRDDYEMLVQSVFSREEGEAKGEDGKGEEGEGTGEEKSDALAMKKQDWVLGLGCHLHFDDPARRQVVSAFQSMIESPGCAPAEVPWQGYYSAKSWTQMCMGMYRDRRAQQEMSPREAVCDSLEHASISQTISDTSLTVEAAISQARLEAEASRPTQRFVGPWFDNQPVQPYRTGRHRGRGRPSPRARTASRQILGSMARQLFR